MLRCFIKYKNETNEQVLKKLKINANDVVSFDYKYDGFDAIIYGDGNNDFIIVDNLKKKWVKYIFDVETLNYVKTLNLKKYPTDYKVGNYVLLESIIGKCYVVQPLDTLEKISKEFNIDEKELILKNNLKTNKLFIGQNIWI